MVPSTKEWLAKICSSRVEPARGKPTMKIGSEAGWPQPWQAWKRSRVQEATIRCNAALFSAAL